MATLLRSQRQCSLCHARAHCQLIQLLVPKRHGKAPFYEWMEGWLCPPCQRSYVDGFLSRGVHQLEVLD